MVVTDTVPTGTTYVAGSAECGGTLASGVLTFNVGTLTPGQSQDCSFKVRTDASPFTVFEVDDGFEPDASAWTISNGAGTVDWAIDTTNPRTGTNAMFATNPDCGERPVPGAHDTGPDHGNDPAQLLAPLRPRGSTAVGFDGGVVEISTDGGTTWTDLGPQIVQNGYDKTIASSFGNPLAGQMAFTGTNLTYRETIVDLSSFAGSTAQIRFRVGTDDSIGDEGWWVDDVTLGSIVDVTNVANATSATDTSTSNTVVTKVLAPMGYTAVGPDRAIDTRLNGGARVAAGSTLTVSGGFAVRGEVDFGEPDGDGCVGAWVRDVVCV